MDTVQLKLLARELITKDRWGDVLRRFIDVLKINILMVDVDGEVIIPPCSESGRAIYGGQFLTDSFNFDFTGKNNFLTRFRPQNFYLECNDGLGLQVISIPIKGERDQILAYMIVGPVILNKRMEEQAYQEAAKRLNIKMTSLKDELMEVRVVSFLTLKAILDLLSQIAKDILDLNLEKRRLDQARHKRELLSKEVSEAAKDMFATIHLDELLVTVLDLALNLTQAESGSLMLVDKETGELSIRVSRGIDEEKYQGTRLRMGEGLAGLAAKENRTMIISGIKGENRIQHLLKRPEIRQSAIVPLSSRNRVVGVLNLSTKSDSIPNEFNEKNLQHLSRLISTAIQTL